MLKMGQGRLYASAIEDLLEHKIAEEILVKNPSKGTQFVAIAKNGEIIIEVSKD